MSGYEARHPRDGAQALSPCTTISPLLEGKCRHLFLINTAMGQMRKKTEKNWRSTTRRVCQLKMFSLPLTPEEPCCGSPCWGATGEGAVWDSQTSSVYWRCYDKVLFSLTIRTLCEQPRNTLSFGVSPMSVTLSLPNMGQGTLSAFPVVMHVGVALRYLAPSCTAHMERNVAGEPREHMPGRGL